MNKKAFLENFRIQKALNGYSPKINYGDKLQMFNCLHKVIAMEPKGYTILEDEKNNRFSVPSQKLMLMMKKGLVKNYGSIVIEKAQISGPSRKIGVTPKAINASYAKPGAGGDGKPGPKGEPVGTMKQGGDGEWYKKVSMAPAQWIHVGKGSSHAAPGAEASHPLNNKEDQKKFLQIRELIKTNTHEADHKKLETMAMSWADQLAKYKNKMAYHNTSEVDSKGSKLPPNIPAHAMEEIHKEHDKAVELKTKLIEAIQASKKKKDE